MRVTSHLNLQALFLLQKFGKNRKFHWRQQEKIVNVMNVSQKGTPMYFTDSPHLQSIEAAMKMIPRHPLTQDAEQKGSSMKLKFLSGDHRDRFLSLFKSLRTNPLLQH